MLEISDTIPEVLRKDFVTDVDGFVYFWPSGSGHFPAYMLRLIADELDRLNAPWEAEAAAYFAAQKN